MHENGRLYFEGNAGENAPANMKNAPAAIKTGVPAAAGLPGPQERKHSLGRWTLGRIAPFGRCLISCIYCANALSETDVPAQGGSKGRSPPATTSQTQKETLAIFPTYHNSLILSIITLRPMTWSVIKKRRWNKSQSNQPCHHW